MRFPRRSSLAPLALVALTAGAVAAAPAPAARIAAFGDTPPVVTKLKVKPAKFKALAKGGPVTTKGGALVTFKLSDAGNMTVSFRRATKTGYKAVPGGFTYVGTFDENEVRISGRVGKAALKVGRYRILIKPVAEGSHSAFAPFTITK
jgi:hypothetical protein